MAKPEAPGIVPALAQPGMICRMQFNLGEQERLLSFETFFDRDESQEEIDARLDRMQRAGDRKRAQHLLPGYRRQRENVQHDLDENRKRLAGMKAALAEADKIRDERRAELRVELGRVVEHLRNEHYASGRRGEFREPKNKDTAAIQSQLDALDQGQQKDHSEAELGFSETENAIKQGERAIEQIDVMIAEYETLARGEPLVE